jgi:uncharacterized glyoxalase superfamily protein PhnB
LETNRTMTNRSAPNAPLMASLIYDDIGRAIEWLAGAFGFVKRLTAPGPDGKIGHAQMSCGGGAILLGTIRDGFGPPRAGDVSQTLCVRVEDVDRHFAHAKQFGARIMWEPATHMYGERQYTAEDLARHRWTFTQTAADVDPADWGATLFIK